MSATVAGSFESSQLTAAITAIEEERAFSSTGICFRLSARFPRCTEFLGVTDKYGLRIGNIGILLWEDQLALPVLNRDEMKVPFVLLINLILPLVTPASADLLSDLLNGAHASSRGPL